MPDGSSKLAADFKAVSPLAHTERRDGTSLQKAGVTINLFKAKNIQLLTSRYKPRQRSHPETRRTTLLCLHWPSQTHR